MKKELIIDESKYMREKRKYYIYIHTCPDDKCYVGLSKSPIQRWNNGKGYKENPDFYKAIQIFGWGNIQHEIVAETYYGWLARKIEKDLIRKFKKDNKSYNMVNDKEYKYISQRKIPLKRVGKYTKDGELIKIYNSASEAWKDKNVNPSSIQACCRGRIRTAGGFIWKYL